MKAFAMRAPVNWLCFSVMSALLCAPPAAVAGSPDDGSRAQAADDSKDRSIPPKEIARPNFPRDKVEESAPGDDIDFMDQAIDRVQSAFAAMQAARMRIARSDTGLETQKLQEQAVKDLEVLLKLAQQRNNQKRQQQSAQSQRQNSQNSSQAEQVDRDGRKEQGAKSSDNGGKGSSPTNRRSTGTGDDSEERTDAAPVPATEQARRMQAIKDVWGHLPPHVREAMLNSVSEKYLPKYEEMVKKYFEDLAENMRKRNRK
jgi:hypothetical protein